MPKSGVRISLDSDVAIAVLNDTHGAGEWIQTFEEVCLPIPVVGELRFGAVNSGRPQQNLARIDGFIARCLILDVVLDTTEHYARVRLGLKQKGRPIPENDTWIAAVCLQHGLPLATFDGHFDEVDGLTLATTFRPSR